MNGNHKKVLIITYYWPPCGGIGVLRCLKFAKYLRDYGWEPIIFTAEDAHYPSIDHSNDADIPEGITILRQKIWEPYHIYKYITGQPKEANVNNVFYASEKKQGLMHKLSVWVRSNFFIPDARCFWIEPSVRFLLEYLKEHPVDALLSNGPPHSNTRIATLIKKATGIPWLADFQDPWSQVDYFSMLRLTPWGLRKHLHMEQEAFAHADATTIVSPTWKRDLEAIGARNVSVLPWGYDASDFAGMDRTPQSGFTIIHAGIMGHDRHPGALPTALTAWLAQNPEARNTTRLLLAGLVDDSIKQSLETGGLGAITHYMGQVSRKEALQLLLQSSVLLLVLNNQPNAAGRIPGKFFEYLAAGRPILCIGPAGSDVQAIMEQEKAGYYCTYQDEAGMRNALQALYAQAQQPVAAQPGEAYSNSAITGRLAHLLNQMTQTT